MAKLCTRYTEYVFFRAMNWRASKAKQKVHLRKNGQSAAVTMHLIEGSSEEEIKRQLMQSLDAFFDFYPEL